MGRKRWCLWCICGCLRAGRYNPQASGWVAASHEDELAFVVDVAVLFGEDGITPVVAELFD